jgi:hypothetical protein
MERGKPHHEVDVRFVREPSLGFLRRAHSHRSILSGIERRQIEQRNDRALKRYRSVETKTAQNFQMATETNFQTRRNTPTRTKQFR